MLLEAEIACNIYCLLKVILKGKAPKILQPFPEETLTSLMGWNIVQELLSSVYRSGSSGRTVTECEYFVDWCMKVS